MKRPHARTHDPGSTPCGRGGGRCERQHPGTRRSRGSGARGDHLARGGGVRLAVEVARGWHVPRRVGVVVLQPHVALDRWLRPHQGGRHRRLRHLLEPAPAHARRHEPRRRRGRERARAGPRNERAGADERRPDVHVHPQARRSVRASGQPRDHVGRRSLCDRARQPSVGRPRLSIVQGASGDSAPSGRGRRSRSPGSSTPNDEDDRVQPHAARGRLPGAPHPSRLGAAPARGRQVLRRQAGCLRVVPRLVGAVHDRRGGRGQAR